MDTGNSKFGENSSTHNSETSISTERRSTRASRLKAVESITKEFLRNFDPEQSQREKRKLYGRLHHGNKKHSVYNEDGSYIRTGHNLCDCLNIECAGCHLPCPKCGSSKCGHECRNHRKWTYEYIENEGSDIVIKNPLLNDT